ncbi:MAG: DUF167 domain-containing protein [Pirellulales bacterium]|nr:DUF167 domain-containing protein [Pirellulales bacterium]
MSCCQPHPEGALLWVRAQPGARRNELRGVDADRLKVAVSQVAEKGKANAAIVELLAKRLGCKRSQIELIAGPTSAEKRFLIRGVDVLELESRIAAATAES